MSLNENISTLKVLVTGGSGFIGTNAVDYLIEQGIETINIDFNSPKKKSHNHLWKNIDIRNYELLEKEFISFQPTHVLHLAATLGMEQYDLDYFSTNTDGVKNILECCQRTSSVRQVLFTSSLLVCENGYIPNGDTDYCPPNNYGKSKMIGEKIIRSFNNPNFIWSIVRPTSIWGPWFEYSYKTFFQMIDKGLYFHIGNNSIIKPKSYVGNTVYMMYKILFEYNAEKVCAKMFYLSDYPEHTTKVWANTIQKILNARKIITLPLFLFQIGALCGDLLKLIGYKEPPLTSFRLKNMLTGGSYPIENTKMVCGSLPINLETAVYETSLWMYEQNQIKHKPSTN